MSIDENGLESKIKKVNTMFIFLIKYLPVILLFVLGMKLPTDSQEALLFISGSAIAFMFQYLFLNYLHLFKRVFILLVVIMYVALYFGYAYEIEAITLYALEVIMVFFIYREIALGKYKGYYYLENYEKKAKVTVAKKKERPLIPLWGSKGFFKKKTGFDLAKEFSVGGFYFRLDGKVEA